MAEADPEIAKPANLHLEMAFAVRMDALLAVRPFISTEETRYYLNGVAVQPAPDGEGVVCVATDGHRLGVQRSKDGICNKPVIVKLPAAIKAPTKSGLKDTGGRYPWLVCMERNGFGHLSIVPVSVSRDDDTADNAVDRIDFADLRIGNAVIDGTFPDWSRIVPREKEGVVKRAFNAKYLADFGQRGIMIQGTDPTAPHIVRTTDDDFFGVLMPMLWDASDGVPTWLDTSK